MAGTVLLADGTSLSQQAQRSDPRKQYRAIGILILKKKLYAWSFVAARPFMPAFPHTLLAHLPHHLSCTLRGQVAKPASRLQLNASSTQAEASGAQS